MKRITTDFDENSIYIFYYQIPDDLSRKIIFALISLLPEFEQIRLHSIKQVEAQQKSLFGRIILHHILSEFSAKKQDFIQTSKTGKPFLPFSPQINFNISHSAKRVVCGFTKKSTIGIDVEKIRSINLDIYKQYFSHNEWNFIHTSNNPQLSFFNLWTRKEAVIKADGRGMEINLSTLNCLHPSVNSDLNRWHIKDLNIGKNYACSVACNKDKKIELFDFAKLYEIETLLKRNVTKSTVIND